MERVVTPVRLFQLVRDSAGTLARAGAIVSGQAAAHLHLAVASATPVDGPLAYSALSPRSATAIYPGPERVPGFEEDRSQVAETLRANLGLFVTRVVLPGTTGGIEVLSREALLAQLLAEGMLSIALAGSVLKVAGKPPVDPDHVREILKAARLGDKFQPMLELVHTI